MAQKLTTEASRNSLSESMAFFFYEFWMYCIIVLSISIDDDAYLWCVSAGTQGVERTQDVA